MDELVKLLESKQTNNTEYTHVVTAGDVRLNVKLTPATLNSYWGIMSSMYRNNTEIDTSIEIYEKVNKTKIHPVIQFTLPTNRNNEYMFDPEIAKNIAYLVQYVCYSTLNIDRPEDELECVVIGDQTNGLGYIHLYHFKVDLRTIKGLIIRTIHEVGTDILSNCGYRDTSRIFYYPLMIPVILDIERYHIYSYPYITEEDYCNDSTQFKDVLEWIGIDSDSEDEGTLIVSINQRLSVHSEDKSLPIYSQSKANLKGPKKMTRGEFTSSVKIGSTLRGVNDKIPRPVEKPIDMIPDLMKMFSISRIRCEIKWKEIGEAIYSTTEGDSIGLDMWRNGTIYTLENSRLSDDVAILNERLEIIEETWDSFGESCYDIDLFDHPSIRLTFSTLKFWASIDSHDLYIRYREGMQRVWLMRSLNSGAGVTDVAALVRFMYEDKYKVSALSSKIIWYEFSGHRWKKIQNGYTLRKKLSDEVRDLYEAYESELSNELGPYVEQLKVDNDNVDLGIFVERGKETLARCKAIIKSLGNPSSKTTIMSEIAEYLYEPEFQELRDENPKLMCHKNGVYDLSRMQLREGRPSDYITLSTNVDYEKPTDAELLAVDDYMLKVFVDPELREYVWNITSTILEGYNFYKALYVLIGKGNNSKSAFVSLLERVLGEYIFKLPINILTNDSGNGEGASPFMASGKGKRLAVFDELNKDGRLKDGPTKRITGNVDKVPCRELYGEPFSYRPQFKSLILTNNPVHVTPDQQAMLQRINEIMFGSKFSPKCPETLEEQIEQKHFPIDIMFDRKFPKMVKAFLWKLTEVHYRNFKENGIKEPECILKRRDEFLRNSDVYEMFKCGSMEELDGTENIGISTDSTYLTFKIWYKEQFNMTDYPGKTDFIEMMSKKLDKDPTNGNWIGWDLKSSVVDQRKSIFNRSN